MKDIIATLKELGEIAHWRVLPSRNESGGDHSCPPIITWTYKQQPADLIAFFRRMVSTFQGSVAWEFSVLNDTFALMPSRIMEYAKSHGEIGALAAALQLMTVDPEFGKRCNTELSSLADHIQHHIGMKM